MNWLETRGDIYVCYTLRASSMRGFPLGFVDSAEHGQYRARQFGESTYFVGSLEECKAWLEAVCSLGD